ncbi:MAG: ATP-dependent sacrificial sulfur transferase LarE [Acetatifactor sp.]|nr:ATP-dependent sacrificial sulfur transferase LarE [Acetatifactor sp.]
MISDTEREKLEALRAYFKELGNCAIAFSGGVDSTFMAKVAHDVLGEKMLAITVVASSFPKREMDEAKEFCKKEGIPHVMVEYDELSIPGFKENPKDRCYICKKALFGKMMEIAKVRGFINLAEGSNMDDNGDYRPGLLAIKEMNVKSPLRHVGLTKAEIRDLSKELGLPTWNKPSFACLASRFPYGEEISHEKLDMVGKAELLLIDMGFEQMRVRIHGNIARIEVLPQDILKVAEPENRERIVTEFKNYGFSYVSLDLQGYRTGSMNEILDKNALSKGKNL